eukprot:8884618-Heterocapsa_arctica.AAC.1
MYDNLAREKARGSSVMATAADTSLSYSISSSSSSSEFPNAWEGRLQSDAEQMVEGPKAFNP